MTIHVMNYPGLKYTYRYTFYLFIYFFENEQILSLYGVVCTNLLSH